MPIMIDNTNTYKLGDLTFSAKGDRIIIREDEFKTGYECTRCGGATAVSCDACTGTGLSPTTKHARCSTCAGTKKVICPQCEGKGGLLIAPETSQRRPTTGVIVSVGPTCKDSHVGDGVMYSNFAGYVVDLADAGSPVTLRILHETEVLCGMEGQLQLRSFRGKTEIAEFGG